MQGPAWPRQIYPILYNQEVSNLKPITWLGDSLARLRATPADIRSDAGYQLDLVQRGEAPADFKPMPDIGSCVMEIRLHGDSEYRVFCVARFEECGLRVALLREKDPGDQEGRPRAGQTTLRRLAGCEEIESKEMTVMKSTHGTTITKGSVDVFADLGFSPAESRNLRLRSQMMTALRKFIEKERLTQAVAAKRLEVSQPRISDLTRGKISRFSLDTLVNMLADAGLEVDLRIKEAPRRVA